MKKFLKIVNVLAIVFSAIFMMNPVNTQAAGEVKVGEVTLTRVTSKTDSTPIETPIAPGEKFYVQVKWQLHPNVPGAVYMGGLDSIMWINHTAAKLISVVGSGNGAANIATVFPEATNDDGEGPLSFAPGGEPATELYATLEFEALENITQAENEYFTLGMAPHPNTRLYPGKYLWFVNPDYAARKYTVPGNWDNLNAEGKLTIPLVREAQKHTVTYAFDKDASAPAFPSTIVVPTPTQHNAGDNVTLPSITSPVQDAANNGVWTFNGWNPATINAISKDETVTGSWTFTPNPVAPVKYTVTYAFDKDASAPAFPSTIVVPTATQHDAGDNVTLPSITSPVQDAANNGVWTFNGWNPATINAISKDETVTGSWTFTPNPVVPAVHTVTYAFVSADVSKALPQEVTNLLPTPTQHNDGSTVTISNTFSNVVVNDGTWTFTAWNPATINAISKDETVTGTWTFTANPVVPVVHTVTYAFVSADASKALPQEVTNLLPTPTQHNDGSTVTISNTFSNVVVNDGTWTFTAWNPATINAISKDETVTGTWTFTANPVPQPTVHTVTYVFISDALVPRPLPQEVANLLPAPTQHNAGDNVTISSTFPNVVLSDGVWVFQGWDPATINAISKDETVTAAWAYIPNPTPQPTVHTVTYAFVSADVSKALPQEVTNLLPTPTQHNDGSTVTISNTFSNVVVNDGTWAFTAWNPATINAIAKDETVTGTWTFTANPVAPVKYTVTYTFDKNAGAPAFPSTIVVPAATQHNAGDNVTLPSITSPVQDAANNGVWTFNGWNPARINAIAKNETATGSWTFTPNPVAPVVPNPKPTPTPTVAPTQPTPVKPEVKWTCADEGKVWSEAKQACVASAPARLYKVPNTATSANALVYYVISVASVIGLAWLKFRKRK